MPDDLDNLIRAAMKTLDEQVPSGYFEALPNQTLARLEGSSMQQGSSGTTTRAADKVGHALPAPVTLEPDTAPVAKQPSQNPDERDEDSGLHDIRNLAQSTKQRLSKRSITQNPPIADDVLASSSGSFKNIALPQPARMVSLPEVADVKEIEKAARAPKKTKEPSEKKKKEEVVAPVAIAETNLTAMPAAPEVQAQAVARSQFTLPSQQNKRSKGPLIALVGTGLAAAAGYVIFLQVQKSEDTTASPSMAAEQTAAPQAAPVVTTGAAGSAAAVTAQPIEEPAPPVPAEAPKADEGAAGAGAQIAADDNAALKDEAAKEEKADKPADKKKPTRAKGGKNKVEKEAEPEPPPAKKVEVKPETKAEVKKPAGKGEEGEPSFDALLKEAGVDEKKEVKPKLEKKSLTGDDFKKGMASVAGKAKGCYKGTQGTAMVKLTVAPSGQVSKVSVGGDFAGKPEGNCVESAIKSASFPPWDGGPMSFTYSVLLAD